MPKRNDATTKAVTVRVPGTLVEYCAKSGQSVQNLTQQAVADFSKGVDELEKPTRRGIQCEVLGCKENASQYLITTTFPFMGDDPAGGRAIEEYRPFISKPLEIQVPICEKHALIYATSDSTSVIEGLHHDETGTWKGSFERKT